MSTPLGNTKVFKPLKVGNVEVQHRIFYPPTTRFRATEDHVPSDLQLSYYDKRTKFPGTLIVTEGTFVSPQASGYDRAPGIWNATQSKAWKKINDQIHANKSFSSIQLWNLGRAADPAVLKKNGLDYVSSSATYTDEEYKKKALAAGNPLRALTTAEVKEMISKTYVNAAQQAVDAGFDILELHGAHGYLLDQFTQPAVNKRTDEYGGSIENRARLILELVDTLSEKFGASKIALRISPWAKFEGMKAEEDEVHPIATFGYLLSELQKRADAGKELAYISIVEPRVSGIVDVSAANQKGTNDFVYQIWKGKVLRAGNYSYDAPKFTQILKDVEDDRTLVGFSRYFTSNPDLIHRLEKGLELTKYDRDNFYAYSNYRYDTWASYGEKEAAAESAESKRVAVALA